MKIADLVNDYGAYTTYKKLVIDAHLAVNKFNDSCVELAELKDAVDRMKIYLDTVGEHGLTEPVAEYLKGVGGKCLFEGSEASLMDSSGTLNMNDLTKKMVMDGMNSGIKNGLLRFDSSFSKMGKMAAEFIENEETAPLWKQIGKDLKKLEVVFSKTIDWTRLYAKDIEKVLHPKILIKILDDRNSGIDKEWLSLFDAKNETADIRQLLPNTIAKYNYFLSFGSQPSQLSNNHMFLQDVYQKTTIETLGLGTFGRPLFTAITETVRLENANEAELFHDGVRILIRNRREEINNMPDVSDGDIIAREVSMNRLRSCEAMYWNFHMMQFSIVLDAITMTLKILNNLLL